MPGVMILASGVAIAVLGFVLGGGPMRLVDWSRKRRQQEIARQIALTDALDGAYGPMVAPVVTKPLFRPWEIQIAVPVRQSAAVARIVSVVDAVFPEIERGDPRPYRIFLTARPESPRETSVSWTPRSATRWIGHRIGAA